MPKSFPNLKIKLITGLVVFFYYGEPVVQDAISKYPEEKFDDHYIFGFPLGLFQVMNLLAYGTLWAYVGQLVFAVISWFLLYKVVIFIKVKLFRA